MSLEVEERAQLRALAHPLRLRMLSLLTSGPASATEVARELECTQANASYHLRTLEAAGLVEVESERSVRGGKERRYRVTPVPSTDREQPEPDEDGAWPEALAAELRRRYAERDAGARATVDAELWVDPALWEEVVADVRVAMTRLHDAAQPPRTDGTVRTSTTAALFRMRS